MRTFICLMRVCMKLFGMATPNVARAARANIDLVDERRVVGCLSFCKKEEGLPTENPCLGGKRKQAQA